MNYHFKTRKECVRILGIWDSMKHPIYDLNIFKPHRLVKIVQSPLTPFFGNNPCIFGVVSDDSKDILFEGICYNYGLNEDGIGFLSENIETIEQYNEILNNGGNIKIKCYPDPDEY